MNAYILSKKIGGELKKKNHIEFRISLINSLVREAADAPKPVPQGRKTDGSDRLTGCHFCDFIRPKEGAKHAKPICDYVVSMYPASRERDTKGN